MTDLYSFELPSAITAQEKALLMSHPFSEVREQIISRNTRLVMLIARKFSNTGVPLDDLFSIGCLALVRAADTFNTNSKAKFSTYAGRCITNAILLSLRRKRAVQKRELSLETPVGYKKNGQPKRLCDTLSSEQDPVCAVIETKDTMQFLLESLRFLSDVEKNVICLRFGLFANTRMTQAEVAKHLGINQPSVSKIQKKALLKIRRYMETGSMETVKQIRKGKSSA